MVVVSTQTRKSDRSNKLEGEWGFGQVGIVGISNVVACWLPLVNDNLSGDADRCMRGI